MEAQPAAAPSTAAQAQAGRVIKSEPSQNSMTGSAWRLTHTTAVDTTNSPRASGAAPGSSEPGKEADRAGADGPGNGVSDMQVLLSEERMDFQHVFEDSAPGMPWARVSFQVSFCRKRLQPAELRCDLTFVLVLNGCVSLAGMSFAV